MLTLLPQATLSSYSDSNWRIEWSDLKMGKCIGRGGFGEVAAATFCCLPRCLFAMVVVDDWD